ncbi:hypothetical protein N9L68_04965 [bacterium]|nr:hypothetical protein [bacterium]
MRASGGAGDVEWCTQPTAVVVGDVVGIIVACPNPICVEDFNVLSNVASHRSALLVYGFRRIMADRARSLGDYVESGARLARTRTKFM